MNTMLGQETIRKSKKQKENRDDVLVIRSDSAKSVISSNKYKAEQKVGMLVTQSNLIKKGFILLKRHLQIQNKTKIARNSESSSLANPVLTQKGGCGRSY